VISHKREGSMSVHDRRPGLLSAAMAAAIGSWWRRPVTSSNIMRYCLGAAVLLTSLLLDPVQGVAQSTAVITGQVTESGTLRPLSAAQVSIPALQRGTVTDASGRYSIDNLPPGTYEVRAQMIGYQATTETVTVSAESTATLDLSVAMSAIGLDEIVVTGVGTV